MDFINDITIKNSKLNFNVDPDAVYAGSVKIFNITGISKAHENQGLIPSEFGALYIGKKDVANDCLICNGNFVDIIFDANGDLESDAPSSIGTKRNIKFITNGMGILGSEINLKSAGSIISSTTKSNLIGANNSIDLVAYNDYDCNGSCAGHNSINFYTKRRDGWPEHPGCIYKNGNMSGVYTEFPDVAFGNDKLTFNLPSQFNDSLTVGEPKSSGDFCESLCESLSNNYGLYVDSTSFTYDNGTQAIDINPLTGMQFSAKCNNVSTDDGLSRISLKSGCIEFGTNSFKINSAAFNINSVIEPSRIESCKALTIVGGNTIGVGTLFFGDDSHYNRSVILEHYFNCTTETDSGCLTLNSKYGNVLIASGCIDSCAEIVTDTYINLDKKTGIDIRTDKTVSISGDGTSKFVSDVPATFNEKAIFNDGICTKTITSIAGTPIFDTTDGKGFNFKGLYTLNGFGTTDKPFFKQESATNNWIDVTTLKEAGTALADKYALKADIPADVDLSNYAQKATTLSGYGITDAYTKSEIDLKDTTFLTKESSGIQTVSSDLALTGYVLIDNLAIDELNIESLTATSKVTLSGGLEVSNGLVADSIKIGSDNVALAKNIPDVSGFITKNVSDLTNYETKTVAEGKYALKTSLSSYVLKSDISNVYKYVGSVNTVSELPTNLTEADAGKVYNIVNASTNGNLSVSAGDNVAWTGSSWDKLGGSVDLSNYIENGSDANLKSVAVSKSSAGKNLVLTAYDDTTAYLGLLDTLPPNENTIPTTLMSFSEGNVGILAPELIQLNSEQLISLQTTVGGVSIVGFDGVYLEHSDGNNINTLELTNSSSAKLYSNKGITIQSDSIKLSGNTTNASRPTYNDSPLALTSDIPNVSSFITKDVSDLTNYETKSVAEGKYAQKSTTLSGYGITDAYTKTEIDLKDSAFLTKESDGIQTVSSDLALTGYVLIDNLAIDELNIESLTANSLVTLSGGLNVTGNLAVTSGTITVGGKEVATKDDIPGSSDVKTPIFKYFQNPVIPASCTLFAIATNAEEFFENMPMMQLVRNSDNKIVSADISWVSNNSNGHDIMVGIDHSSEISANTYTLQAFGY